MSFEVIQVEMEQEDVRKRNNQDLSKIASLLRESKTKQQGVYALASYCLNKFAIITFQETDDVFIYEEGVYVPRGEKILSKHIQENLNLNELLSTHIINELCGYVRRLSYKKRDEIIEPTDKVCLLNCILNLKTFQVEPHSSNIIFFNKIPVEYNEKSSCPNINEFLNEVVSIQDIQVLQEFVGYCLYKRYPIHKIFMLVGGGANGKSTFINLLKTFLGQGNCCAIPLQQLEGNRFAVSNLFGKLTNMFADLSSRALKDTSYLKMLTGEDLIPAERKFKDPIFFSNYAKMIFSCNQIPRSPDDSDAFFRRWIIINFPNQFIGDKADKNKIQKLTSTEELSGFLNFALEGLIRLLNKGDFSHSKGISEVKEQYIRQSDSVGSFIMDLIEISPDNFIQKKELYTIYCDYCRDQNYPIVPENTFHKQLQSAIRVEDYRPKIDGRRPGCWRGIKIKNNEMNNNIDNPDNSDLVNYVSDVKANSHFNSNSEIIDECLIHSKMELFNFINENDTGEGICTQVLIDNSPNEIRAMEWIDYLKEAGDIFLVKNDKWKCLQ